MMTSDHCIQARKAHPVTPPWPPLQHAPTPWWPPGYREHPLQLPAVRDSCRIQKGYSQRWRQHHQSAQLWSPPQFEGAALSTSAQGSAPHAHPVPQSPRTAWQHMPSPCSSVLHCWSIPSMDRCGAPVPLGHTNPAQLLPAGPASQQQDTLGAFPHHDMASTHLSRAPCHAPPASSCPAQRQPLGGPWAPPWYTAQVVAGFGGICQQCLPAVYLHNLQTTHLHACKHSASTAHKLPAPRATPTPAALLPAQSSHAVPAVLSGCTPAAVLSKVM